jgi:glyoxylase-like metal-dependent hydrolase (beta-lactamase superfamily II)
VAKNNCGAGFTRLEHNVILNEVRMTLQVHTIQSMNACAYLIEREAGLFLVDAGWPGNAAKVLRRMQGLGRDDLRLIFITHAHMDHYGSAAALRRLTGAPLAVHRADAEAMARGETPVRSGHGPGKIGYWILRLAGAHSRVEPTPADVVLDDGDDLREYGLDAVVVHAPGHTPGSSCLLVQGRLAFVGDLLTNDGRPMVQRRYADDWSLMAASLARVQGLRPQWVYPGHGTHAVNGEAFQSLRPSVA